MSILTKNWHTWYIGGVDSESRLRFLKFQPQKPFLCKFGPKNSKLSVLSENWCSQYLKDADSKSRLRFLKFWTQNPFWANLGPKSQSCPFCLKIGTHGISKMLILIPTLVFWISNPNFLFGQIWAKKVKVVRFNWKLTQWYLGSADSESGLWFLNFWPQKSILGKFGLKRSKFCVFPENWHAWHLDDADSYSNISFLNFWP